jgi:hypothetical protein
MSDDIDDVGLADDTTAWQVIGNVEPAPLLRQRPQVRIDRFKASGLHG